MNKQATEFPYLEAQSSHRPTDFIPVYEPYIGQLEEEYVLDAVRSGWISYLGRYVGQLEQEFARLSATRHAIAVSNGTVALHLILAALNIGPGDEVIVPAFTFVATANAVAYTGATPVFADADAVTWCIDPADVAQLVTSRTKAIIPVHIYGHPADMDAINAVARAHDLWVIEDAAEAHGAAIGTRPTGGLGHIASFSLMANKIVTTGEGGMVTTNDAGLAARCRHLRDHAMQPDRRYWHDEIGFNYRMTNLQAAVGVAQMTRVHDVITRKRQMAEIYEELLTGVPGLTLPVERPGYTNVYWMYSVLVEDAFPLCRDELIPALRACGIDSRPFFHPMDTLPMYQSATPRAVALNLSRRGLNLPSSPLVTDDQIARICDTLRQFAS